MSKGKYLVDVSALKLSDKALENIGANISKVVLSALAEQDHRVGSRILDYPGHTDGIIVYPVDSIGPLDTLTGPVLVYGAAIQQAGASGSVAAIAAVEHHAEVFLAQAEGVRKELKALRKKLKS